MGGLRAHPGGCLSDHVLRGTTPDVDRLGLEALRDLVAVQAGRPLRVDGFARVLRQVASSKSGLLERARTHRQITEQLDMDVPATPGVTDHGLTDVAADREMGVQPMPTRMREFTRPWDSASKPPYPEQRTAHPYAGAAAASRFAAGPVPRLRLTPGPQAGRKPGGDRRRRRHNTHPTEGPRPERVTLLIQMKKFPLMVQSTVREHRGRIRPRSSHASPSADVCKRFRIAVYVVLVGLALLIRLPAITAPPLDFAPARQTYDALRARVIYLEGSHLPPWKQAVVQQVRSEVPQIEPPVMEHLAALSYRLVGSEQLWIPRLLSLLFWLVGGAFVYRIATRLAREPGPLVSVGIYLLMPFGIFGSRSFQPDPMMVMLTLGALVAIVRFHERTTARNLAIACSASAVAVLSKPGIPVFFLWGTFLALSIVRHGVRRSFSNRHAITFVLASFAPAALYYLWGTAISGFLRGHTESSLQPNLLINAGFWQGWMGMIASVVAYPLNGLSGVNGLLIVLGLAVLVTWGCFMIRTREGRGLLSGLWLGYFVFGLAFTTHISTHSYYSLPLVPIIALSLAPVGERTYRLLRPAPLAVQASAALVCCLVLIGVAVKVQARLLSGDYRARVHIYQQIGALVGHTTAGVHVDPTYDTPLLYYAWIASSPLYYPEEQLLHRGDIEKRLRQIEVDAARPQFLIVTAMQQLRTQPLLEAFTRPLHVIKRTPYYAIFTLPDSSTPKS